MAVGRVYFDLILYYEFIFPENELLTEIKKIKMNETFHPL